MESPKHKVGRSDILCKRDGRNLFVIELKNDSVTINQSDIDKGISYARLLPDNIAPFTIVSNNRGKKEIVDVETKQLTALALFREFTEGAGHFLFRGDSNDFMKLKTKLMEEERPRIQLDTLGWNRNEFFAFSNGVVFRNAFVPVDEFGVVQLDEVNYFIPYHPGTDEMSNMNEKRFAWTPGAVTWGEWSEQYYKVFGSAGMVAMLFGVATVFSDHIFAIKGNFPMLFFYGEGGSGKSKLIQYLQHWFGEPQPSLKVSEKANTDKGKIRKMAQFSNAIALLEEYVNTQDIAVTKTFTGFYDRYGYERADIDSKYGTETVPVKSTVAFTGNEYPADDPFLQRLILVDHNLNEFTNEQHKNFEELNKMNRKGLTQIMMHLLQFRKAVVEHWESYYDESLQQFKAVCADLKAPSRMVENAAVLIVTYKTLHNAGLSFPFQEALLVDFLHTSLQSQVEKRDTSSGVARFWDIFTHLLMQGKISQGRHFDVSGNELSIRFSEIHTYYVGEHMSLYRQSGLNKPTLSQKLKDSPAFMQTKDSHRYKGGDGIKSSAFVFAFDKVPAEVQHWITKQF